MKGDCIANPSSILPSHAKVGKDTVMVEVTQVLAMSLVVPGHSVKHGNKKRKHFFPTFVGTTPTSHSE